MSLLHKKYKVGTLYKIFETNLRREFAKKIISRVAFHETAFAYVYAEIWDKNAVHLKNKKYAVLKGTVERDFCCIFALENC